MALELFIHGSKAGSTNEGTISNPINDFATLRNRILAYNAADLTITLVDGAVWKGHLPEEHLNYNNVLVRTQPGALSPAVLDGGERFTDWTEIQSGFSTKRLWQKTGLTSSLSGTGVLEPSSVVVDGLSIPGIHWSSNIESTATRMQTYDFCFTWDYAASRMLLMGPLAFNPNNVNVKIGIYRNCIRSMDTTTVQGYVLRDLIFRQYGMPVAIRKAPGALIERITGYNIGGGYRSAAGVWDGSLVELAGECTGAVVQDVYGSVIGDSVVSIKTYTANTQNNITVRRIQGEHCGLSVVNFDHQVANGSVCDNLVIDNVVGSKLSSFDPGNLRPDTVGTPAVVSYSQLAGTSVYRNPIIRGAKSIDSPLVSIQAYSSEGITCTIERCVGFYASNRTFDAFKIIRPTAGTGTTTVNLQANVLKNISTGVYLGLNTGALKVNAYYNSFSNVSASFNALFANNVTLELQNNVFVVSTVVENFSTAAGSTATSKGGNYVSTGSLAGFTAVTGDTTGQPVPTYDTGSYNKPVSGSALYGGGVALTGTRRDQLDQLYPTTGVTPRGAYAAYSTLNTNIIGSNPSPSLKRVLLLGDIGTAGSAAADGVNEAAAVSYRGYFGTATKTAGLQIDLVGPNTNTIRNGYADVEHAGFAGATIGPGDNGGNNLSDRVLGIIAAHPSDAIIVMIGLANLAGSGNGTTGLASALTTLLDKIATAAPNTKIMAAIPPQPTWLNESGLTSWNEMLVAAQNWASIANDNRYVANVHVDAQLTGSDFVDGTYWNATGAAKVGAAVALRYPNVFQAEIGLPPPITRVNLVLGATDFSTINTPWVLSGGTMVANLTTPPAGVSVSHTMTNGTGNMGQQITGVVANQPFTVYIQAKKNTHGWLGMKVNNGDYSAATWAFFDLNTGALGRVFDINLTGGSAVTKTLDNGYYRCSITNTMSDTVRNIEFYACNANETYAQVQGHSILIAGIQGEYGTRGTKFKNTTKTATTIRTLSKITVSLPTPTLAIGGTQTATITALDNTDSGWDLHSPVTTASSSPAQATIATPTGETNDNGVITALVTGVATGATSFMASAGGLNSLAVPMTVTSSLTLVAPLPPVATVVNSDTITIGVGNIDSAATNVVVMGAIVTNGTAGSFTVMADRPKGSFPVTLSGLKPGTRYRFYAYSYVGTIASSPSASSVEAVTNYLIAETTAVSPSAVGVTGLNVQVWRAPTNGAIVGESLGLYTSQQFDAQSVLVNNASRARLRVLLTEQPAQKLRNGDAVCIYPVKPGSPPTRTKILTNAVIREESVGAIPLITSDGGGDVALVSKPENQTAVTTVTATE